MRESFIYTLSEDNNFEPIKSEQDLVIFAPSDDIKQQVRQNISLKFPQVESPFELIPIFSESIRMIEHESSTNR